MENFLVLNNISKIYQLEDSKTVCILNDVSISFPSTGLFVIYGKSGCGKSTLLNIMECITKPSQGAVFFNGKDILKFDEKEKNKYLKDDIGIIFQNFNLINDLTVYENLILACEIKDIKGKEEIEKLLESFELISKRNECVNKLSGGEKQRVSIIRALLNNPSVIYADEPTGNLDNNNSKIVFDILKNISKERLVIVVTHDLELAEKYYDGYYDLNNKLFKIINREDCNERIEKEKANHKHSFLKSIFKSNIKRNIKRNLVSFLASFFASIIVLFSIGISNGVKQSDSKLLNTYQNLNVFNVSKIDYEEITDSSLKIRKISKASNKEIGKLLHNYSDYQIGENLDYFFTNEKTVSINGVDFNNVSFMVVNNIKNTNEVYVNDAFKKLYAKHFSNSCLNELVNVHLKREIIYDTTYTFNKGSIIDNFSLFLTFKIEQINQEFDFLNYPKIYFSYDYFITRLKSCIATEVADRCGELISYYDILCDSFNPQFSSYKNIIFLDTLENSIDFYENHDDSFSIENSVIENVYTFKELSNALIKGGVVFIVFSCFCSLLIIALLTIYSYIFNKREIAIINVLGSSRESVAMTYALEQIIVSCISFIISLFICFFLFKYINIAIYNKFTFKDLLIMPNNFLSFSFIYLLFALEIVFVFCYFPIYFNKKVEISRELKEL